MDARRRYPDARDPVILRAAREGIAEAHAAGTGLIGDISNTLVTPPLLKELGMRARVFYELLGFNVEDPVSRVAAARIAADEAARDSPGVRVSLAPHAPYSVSPGLFAAIRADLDAHRDDVSSIHLAESGEEVEFIARGTGPWRELLTSLGVWTDAWLAPAVSPVTYLAEAGFLDGRVLAVHGVQCGPEDLGRLRGLGTTIVSCPRSNRHVGAGDPPLADFYAACVPVAFGTDSLASVGDLNIFTELAGARALAPDVPARRLLESATLAGARALGFGGEMGSIERGKRASLIAARLPADAGDVEEYLLSGIDPGEITWVDEQNPKAQ
jgi:cytosine/adenosine deaminase-related metal-dependent hydrolase